MQSSYAGQGVAASYFYFCHTKYIAKAQCTLTGLHGAVSEKFKHDIIWNGTVNNKGGVRNKIFANVNFEHMNKEF